MTFRQGAMALVLAGLLQRLRGGWKFVDPRAEARRLPGGSVHGANHALFRPEPPGGGKTSLLKSGNSLSTATSRRAFAMG